MPKAGVAVILFKYTYCPSEANLFKCIIKMVFIRPGQGTIPTVESQILTFGLTECLLRFTPPRTCLQSY